MSTSTYVLSTSTFDSKVTYKRITNKHNVFKQIEDCGCWQSHGFNVIITT